MILSISQQKQISHFNTLIGNLTDIINNAKEEWEGEQNIGIYLMNF